MGDCDVLFIDAANLRSGGAITHITEMLNNLRDDQFLFKKVVIAGGDKTVGRIHDRAWVQKITHKWLNKGLPYILLWKLFYLRKHLSDNQGIFFSPAGTYIGDYQPYCAMSRNMLIFDLRESRRYGWSWMRFKFWLLRKVQRRSFEKACLIIFISKYAKETIAPFLKKDISNMPVIHHGINKRFECKPREQFGIEHYSFKDPFKLLYVSPISVYKHQWVLIKAVSRLRNEGYPLRLDLIGDSYGPSLKKVNRTLLGIRESEKFIFYHGRVPYEAIHNFYIEADGFAYCSTCENMPNILIEAMNSGLPIACSNFPPMSEFLGESEFYFDPTQVDDIYKILKDYLDSPVKRYEHALNSFSRSLEYSWEKCAERTFSTLANICS